MIRPDRVICLLGVALAGVVATASPIVAQTPPPQPPTAEVTVDVIGTTPLPGVELPLDKIPSPVQTALAKDIENSGALDLADFLNRQMTSVHVNDVQGNPFQPDINYRGYTSSPLLGTPQGLSVFMDGVRMNQAFGEVVSWDLIPRLAIASTTLMPGSNPLFGLNTLGGALAIQTKDGRGHAGTHAQLTVGSPARRAVEFEHGGARASGFNWYVAGNVLAEDGWRDRSPSRVAQLFGKVGWERERSGVAISSSFADTALTGNGLQDSRLLAADYASVYTSPDTTDNRAGSITTGWHFRPRPTVLWSGNAYYRNIHGRSFNGDINEDSLDQSLYQPNAREQAALTAAGYTGFPTSGESSANTPFPSWRCIANGLLQDEPAAKCNGLLNHTGTAQQNGGASAQTTHYGSTGKATHQLTAGAAVDLSGIGFSQSTELGYLNPDRTVTGIGAFGDSVTGGSVGGEPYDTRVDLDGTVRTWSAYATDTISAGAWTVTLSGRFNRSTVDNRDRIRAGGEPGSLTATNAFARFNPAAGATVTIARSVNLYAGYSEGNRAPTSIELGCANPDQPCKLPNAMAGDPPLHQVVTRTIEGGARGGSSRSALGWSAGVFFAENSDDILFVSSEQTGFGYFRNFGETRRQGLELSMTGRLRRVHGGAGYTWLAATYQSEETVNGTGNSANDRALAGERGFDAPIVIVPGNRMPLIPRQMFKAFGDIDVNAMLSFDVNLIAMSGMFARGNENNAHQPDGQYYLGPGTTDAYAVVNAGGRVTINKRLQIVAEVNNVFDQHFATAAQLGPAGFTGSGTFIARALPPVKGEFPVPQTTFLTPGAPRLFWVGSRIRF